MTNERPDGYNVSIKQMIRTKCALKVSEHSNTQKVAEVCLHLAVFWPFAAKKTLAKSGRLSAAANIFPSIAVYG